jgi:hypothetical protein
MPNELVAGFIARHAALFLVPSHSRWRPAIFLGLYPPILSGLDAAGLANALHPENRCADAYAKLRGLARV